jgi:DNA-binding winged helix-turn-helix (wHTH) protein
MARTTPGLLNQRRADGAEERIQLREATTTLGRSDSCTVVVALPNVSRLHARIELQHDCYMIYDAGSANGTFVNGKPIEHGHKLNTGDEIWLGAPAAALWFTDPEETLVGLPGIVAPPLLIDEDARTLKVYGVPVQLSPLEYGLLLHLSRAAGTVCTRDKCFLAVWGQPYDQATCEDAFNACITKLRRHLRVAAEAAGQPAPIITTVQRIGFRLDAPVTFASQPARATPANDLTYAG